MNREKSWENEKHIMYNGLASKGYIWMDKEEEKIVDAALEEKPDDFYLLCAKGILNFNYNWDVAVDCFSRALVIRPFDSNQYYNRGRKYLSQDRIYQALADITMSVKLDEDDNWKWHYLGVCYYLLQKFDSAAQYFEKSLEVSLAHDKDLISCEADWLWTTYCHMGEYEKAQKAIGSIDKNTLVVPVIGDDDGYKNVCLLINEIITVDEFLETVGPENEGGSVNELYGLAKYYYYVKHDLENALRYLDKTLSFTNRKGGWGYKMAAMDKPAWDEEYKALNA